MLPSIWFTEPLCWSYQHLSGRLFSESGIWPNIVWDSGEHKISWWDTGFDCYSGSGTCQNLGRYWERKWYFGIEIYSSRTDIFDAGSREKRVGMREGSEPPSRPCVRSAKYQIYHSPCSSSRSMYVCVSIFWTVKLNHPMNSRNI